MRYNRLTRLLALTLMLCLPAAMAEGDVAPDAEVAQEIEIQAGEAQANALEEIDLALSDAATEETGDVTASSEAPVLIELGVKQTYALKLKGSKLTYKSSNKKVATVSKKGVVKAVKKGTATIRCYSGGVLASTCQVKVVAAPKKVSLGVKKLTLGVKETAQLEPTITKGSLATFTWSTSKKKVATVSKKGVVKGKKKGTATITVKTQNGKKAKVVVTVKKAPGKVTLDRTKLELQTGRKTVLKAKLPKNTASRITWYTSAPEVATVADGVVTAVGEGKATITAVTFNGRAAECAVTVGPGEDRSVQYRALLIGEEDFTTPCTRNRGDVGLMSRMLKSVKGLFGNAFQVTCQYDLDRSGVLSAISKTFSGADENDVSLFFIATHGVSSAAASDRDSGALLLVPESKAGNILRLEELAGALTEVPGKVIVILESCGSGAGVYANGDEVPDVYSALEAFDQAAARAFSEADPGVWVELEGNQMDSSGNIAKTGELRIENKFYVLTASDYQEDSWGLEKSGYNYFTHWLTSGVGTSGSMPADNDGNGCLTLKELYGYIKLEGDYFPIASASRVYYQHAQVYPADSGFVLFAR